MRLLLRGGLSFGALAVAVVVVALLELDFVEAERSVREDGGGLHDGLVGVLFGIAGREEIAGSGFGIFILPLGLRLIAGSVEVLILSMPLIMELRRGSGEGVAVEGAMSVAS